MMGEMFRDNAPLTAAAGGDRSSSTACAPAGGASSSATTPTRSTRRCAPTREAAYGPDGLALGTILGQ